MDQNTIIGALVVIGIFMVIREIWTWYWKINEMIAQMKVANALLTQIRDEARTSGAVLVGVWDKLNPESGGNRRAA